MKNERGITLIMLIITIIVMIILAAIVINIALRDKGIFTNVRTAQIMGKVEALDDSIKAYTLKSDDPYSSSKKTIDDLVTEGILKKITLLGEDATSEDDDKSIYYVNFENNEISVAEALGLTSKNYENTEKLTTFTYNKLEDLQNKGIYVVDNDLNAAYLKNNRTYGTLTNFGEKDNIEIASEFASQSLTLKINPGEQAVEQEVILVIDRTVSMALADDVAEADDISLIMNSDGTVNYEESYNKTRWAGAVKALDSFADTYFEKCPTGKITIYTFYGTNNTTIQKLGSFEDAATTKQSYANILSRTQFETAVSNLVDKYTEYKQRYNNTNAARYTRSYFNIGNSGYFSVSNSGKYEIDCRLMNETYTRLFDNNPASLGYSTCAPNALYMAYQQAMTNQGENIATNVVIMTDGDSNAYWGTCKNAYSIGTVASSIMNLSIDIDSEKKYNFGVYAVGFGKDAEGFETTFSGNYTGFYKAENSEQLLDSFTTIASEVGDSMRVQTDSENSHSIQTVDDQGQLIAYKIENVNKIVLELKKSNGEAITLIFERDSTGAGGIYNLNTIYDEDEHIILLENAWEYTGLSSGELTNDYPDKVISVYTD